VSVVTGNSDSGRSGDLALFTGSSGLQGGDVFIKTGGIIQSGNIAITAGSSDIKRGGSVSVLSGSGGTAIIGSVSSQFWGGNCSKR